MRAGSPDRVAFLPLDPKREEEELEIYFANECALVIVVDPERRVVEMHDGLEAARSFGEGATARSATFDDLAPLFAGL